MDDKKVEKWTDKKCITIACRDNFPSIVKDIDKQKSIINRFLNFYLTGNVQKGLSITDLMFAVISIMPFSPEYTSDDSFIWGSCHYSDNGTLFFLSPEDKLRHDIQKVMNNESVREEQNAIEVNLHQKNDNAMKVPNNDYDNENQLETNQAEDTVPAKPEKKNLKEEVQTAIDVNLHQIIVNALIVPNNEYDNESQLEANQAEDTEPAKTEKTSGDFDSYTRIIMKSKGIKWFRLKPSNILPKCNQIKYGPIENAKFCISCNKLLNQWENVKARQVLKYFFGVIALVLMRGCVKSSLNLETYFSSKFTSLVSTDIFYSPPHKSCISKTWKMFRKFCTPEIQTMFAKLVVNSFYIDRKKFQVNLFITNPTNIFKASLLAHISNYGMGLINMLQVIALHTHDLFYLAFESLQSEETRESWVQVKKYLVEYLSNENEHTHHWARLIVPEQFEDLCCTNNYELAVVMAVYIENLTDSEEIWNSGWTKKTQDLVNLKCLGCKLYKKYKDNKKYMLAKVEPLLLKR